METKMKIKIKKYCKQRPSLVVEIPYLRTMMSSYMVNVDKNYVGGFPSANSRQASDDTIIPLRLAIIYVKLLKYWRFVCLKRVGVSSQIGYDLDLSS